MTNPISLFIKCFSLAALTLISIYSHSASFSELEKKQEMINLYVSAWEQEDPKKQKEILKKALTKDVIHVTPNETSKKVKGILAQIKNLRTQMGEIKAVAKPATFSGNYAHFSWDLKDSNDKLITSGYDTIMFDKNGKIKGIVGFF